jgi:hypothetical protein
MDFNTPIPPEYISASPADFGNFNTTTLSDESGTSPFRDAQFMQTPFYGAALDVVPNELAFTPFGMETLDPSRNRYLLAPRDMMRFTTMVDQPDSARSPDAPLWCDQGAAGGTG